MEEYKVICISVKRLKSKSGRFYGAKGLIKHKLYTVANETIDIEGDKVYYIIEKSQYFMSKRFRKVDTTFSDKVIKKLEEYFKKEELAIAA